MRIRPDVDALSICAISMLLAIFACDDGNGRAPPRIADEASVPSARSVPTLPNVPDDPASATSAASADSAPPRSITGLATPELLRNETCPILNADWKVYELATPSQYVFRLAVGPVPSHASNEAIGPPGELAICRKGIPSLFQRIMIPSLGSRDEYHPDLLVDDFDFDGNADFAIHDGDNGPYGAPTFGIYLRDPTRNAFARSAKLSALAETSIAPMQVDAQKRQLRVASKSGCCIHWFEWYVVEGRNPRLVRRETTEGSDSKDPACRVITETVDVRGNLRRSVTSCASD
jgi:hypothetical protein